MMVSYDAMEDEIRIECNRSNREDEMRRDLEMDDSKMQWTNDRPQVVGMYLFRKTGEWVVRLTWITKGDWRSAQNPDWLYSNGSALQQCDDGIWLGPLLEPPKA